MTNTIEAAVHAATTNIIASGAIERKIEEALTKTIEAILAEHLREYSDFGKQLRIKVSEALAVDFDRLTLPSYGASILSVIEATLKTRADASIAESITHRLDDLLKAPPRTIELSKLVTDYIDSTKGDYERHDSDHVTCIVHHEGGGYQKNFRMVHLAPKVVPDRDRYACPIQIHLMRVEGSEEWKVIGLRIAQKDATKDPMFALGCDAFERDLYSMYASGSRLILDEESVETQYPEDECHC